MEGRSCPGPARVGVLAVVALGGLAGCSLLFDLDRYDRGGASASPEGGPPTSTPAPEDDAGALADAAETADAPPCVPSGTVESVEAGPRTAADDARIGTVAWSNVMNATADDGTFARSQEIDETAVTHWLLLGNFGLELPSRALIRGFVVTVKRRVAYDDEIGDHGVALVRAGTPGAPKARPGAWPATVSSAVYGGPTDLWGSTWTAADVTTPGFGVAVAARGLPAYAEPAEIDYVAMRVHFERCAE